MVRVHTALFRVDNTIKNRKGENYYGRKKSKGNCKMV